MTFLASDVFDGARSPFLNDSAAALFTNATLLPHLKAANEELEQLLIICGTSVQRQVTSSPLAITAGVSSITIGALLPTDFLFPIELKERASGGAATDWVPMTELEWSPEEITPTSSFTYWAFRNNGIYFPAATTNREILLKYERQLAVITGPTSPVDFYLSKRFLCARVAELAARYTGQNKSYADDLAIREVEPRKLDIERMFVLDGQSLRARRQKFTTKTL